jgi:hypothetical protein
MSNSGIKAFEIATSPPIIPIEALSSGATPTALNQTCHLLNSFDFDSSFVSLSCAFTKFTVIKDIAIKAKTIFLILLSFKL